VQVRIFDQIQLFFREAGYSELIVRPVPTFYRLDPIEDDIHALTRIGARIESTKPSCSLSLENWGSLKLSKGRKSSRKKAQLAGVTILDGFQYLPEFWQLLENNLKERHQVRPVHSLKEFEGLILKFPDEIRLTIAVLNGECVAGAIYFIYPRVVHTQYLSSNEKGREVSALDAIIFEGIDFARKRKVSWFDFGTNHTPEGSIDEKLFFYKQSFGAGSFNQWSFLIPL
jgi:lipid II:glycine glycyltransferase (peptidoglycan interpeptide bridge formation enzyme)